MNLCKCAQRRFLYWSFVRKTLLDDKAKGQKDEAKVYFEMHKTADFHSNLLVTWELITEGYQGRPMKYVHFKHFVHFNEMRDRKTLTRHSNSLVGRCVALVHGRQGTGLHP